MKLVFFTQDSEIEELIENISGVEVVLTDTLDGLEEDIEDERCLFFIDFDFDKKHAEQVNDELFEHENVRRIIISSGMRLKDLKKHQKGKHAAHGYLVKPLTLEIVNGVLNDYELSDYILDHQLETDDPDYDDIPLSDIGGKQGAIKEFAISSDVREEMNKHSAKAGEPDLDSTVNLNIQAKFDDVFGGGAEQSFEEDDDFANQFSPDGVPDVPDEVADIPSLAVDFGDSDSASEDLTAGFKAGLSPEDGTGEFEIDASELEAIDEIDEIEELSADAGTEEVDMANDDIELDDTDLEFDDGDAELEEGALEFDGGDAASDLDLGDSGDVTDGGLEFGSSDAGELDIPEDDEVSISLGADDLDLGADDDLDLGGDIDFDGASEAEEVQASAGGDLEFSDDAEVGDLDLGEGDDVSIEADADIDMDDDLDFGDSTNPTMVAQTGALEAANLNLEEDDIAEFSAQGTVDSTTTESELDVAAEVDDSFDLGEDDGVDDLAFDADEVEDATAATTVAATSELDDDALEFGQEEIEDEATVQTVVAPRSPVIAEEKPLPHGQVLESLGQPELLRLQATIKQLREERSGLLSQVDDLKGSIRLLEQDKLTLKAELEESRIEINILKKRHSEENEESRHRNRVLEEKKAFFEEKARTLQKEFDRLSQKVRIDFNKVKQREKELESQLELVTMDTQSQVKSRDMKILELKRKIDSLEFNMENATIREQKSRDDKVRLEERLGKIMKTLRGSIKLLEDDIDLDEETRAQLVKSGKL